MADLALGRTGCVKPDTYQYVPPVAVASSALTKAVVAMVVELSVVAGVGAAGVPVRVGEASGARDVSTGCTWSARAKVVPVPTAAAPFIRGVAVAACPITKAVVAICVVEVETAAVGAAGVPVSVGEATAAREVSLGWT